MRNIGGPEITAAIVGTIGSFLVGVLLLWLQGQVGFVSVLVIVASALLIVLLFFLYTRAGPGLTIGAALAMILVGFLGFVLARGVIFPKQETSVEEQLMLANITLAAEPKNVAQVREWVRKDPAYQALSRECLNLLQNKKLIDNTVPLDVINGKYKELLGTKGSDYVTADKYHDPETLKQAIVNAWKDFNFGRAESSFDEITKARAENNKPITFVASLRTHPNTKP